MRGPSSIASASRGYSSEARKTCPAGKKEDVSFILTGRAEEKSALHVQQIPLNGCLGRMEPSEREEREREGGKERGR